MRWVKVNHPWRRAFALFPVCLSDGPTSRCIWLEWYWERWGGDCIEVSFTDPTTPPPSASEGT